MLSKVFNRNTAPQTAAPTLRFDWQRYVVFFAFLAVFVFFSITLYDSGFLSLNNLLNIGHQRAGGF